MKLFILLELLGMTERVSSHYVSMHLLNMSCPAGRLAADQSVQAVQIIATGKLTRIQLKARDHNKEPTGPKKCDQLT